MIYLIGSMRNPEIPRLARRLREHGFEVFDDWHSPGPRTDEHWQEYELHRGRSYREALDGAHAGHVFSYDLKHLKQATAVVLVTPCGKSGHLELGWALGQGKLGFIYLSEPVTRFDIMYKFATDICETFEELVDRLLLHNQAGGE